MYSPNITSTPPRTKLTNGALSVESAHYTQPHGGHFLFSNSNRTRRELRALLRRLGGLLRALGDTALYALLPSEAFPKAKLNARKALELDHDLAEAHVSLAYSALVYDWNYAEAEKEFRKAIELRPRYATAHQYYAYYLTAMGDLNQAIAERKIAVSIEPKSPLLNTALAEAYYQARQLQRQYRAKPKGTLL